MLCAVRGEVAQSQWLGVDGHRRVGGVVRGDDRPLRSGRARRLRLAVDVLYLAQDAGDLVPAATGSAVGDVAVVTAAAGTIGILDCARRQAN